MTIYTRAGDKGMTSLYRGKRVSKSDIQIDAYGSVDELTSFIGLVASKVKNKQDKQSLIEMQKDFHQIMAVLSGANINLGYLTKKILGFEKTIDAIEKSLPKLRKFILPGGTEMSAWFHILRVICRRAERNVVRFNNDEQIVKYLNRLSDLFFTMARKYGKNQETVL
jgi:cob(I)alamin adenosyltransferase